MGFRLWRRFKIAPGLTVNLSKSGLSLSVGPRGAKYTIGPRGQRATVGLTGSGMFYSKQFTHKHKIMHYKPHFTLQKYHKAYDLTEEEKRQIAESEMVDSVFKNIIAPPDEKPFLDGCKAFLKGNHSTALRYFQTNHKQIDSAFMLGAIYLASGEYEWSLHYFKQVKDNIVNLGRLFDKYGLMSKILMYCFITQNCRVFIRPDPHGLTLLLVETYQNLEMWQDAVDCLRAYQQNSNTDTAILLSLVDLLTSCSTHNDDDLKYVLRLTNNIPNDSNINTAILLCRARALHFSGLSNEAFDLLKSMTINVRADMLERNEEKGYPSLIEAIHMELAVVAESLGRMNDVTSSLDSINAIKASTNSPAATSGIDAKEVDEDLLQAAIAIIRETQRASVSLLQRRLKIGYSSAGHLMDKLEEQGIVGPAHGSDPREILIDLDGEIPVNTPNNNTPNIEEIIPSPKVIELNDHRSMRPIVILFIGIASVLLIVILYNMNKTPTEPTPVQGIVLQPIATNNLEQISVEPMPIQAAASQSIAANNQEQASVEPTIEAPVRGVVAQPIATNNFEQIARSMLRVDKIMKTGDNIQAMVNEKIVNIGDDISVQVSGREYRFKVRSIDVQKQSVKFESIQP